MTNNDNKDPQIREAFEKWYGESPERCSEYPNQYRNMVTQARWEAWRDCHLQLSTELKQLRAERQWQDISTAPKDGTKILAYLIDNAEHRKSFPENERNGIDIIVWTNHNKGGWISNRFGTPTLWVPLLDKLTDSAQRVTNKEGE